MCYRTNSNLNRVCDVRLLYYKFNNLLKFTKAKVESICKNMSNRKKLNWKNNLSNDKKTNNSADSSKIIIRVYSHFSAHVPIRELKSCREGET